MNLFNLDLEMVRIPAGHFLRGVNFADAYEADESPEIQVWVEAFEIQKHPVTIAQWLSFLEDARHPWPKEEWLRVCKEKCAMQEIVGDAPITYVNWFDCRAFANWLTAKSGRNYSLPTENQWEKACRGVSGQKYPWGNDLPNPAEEMLKDVDERGFLLLRPVGQRKNRASPFGVEEMWSGVEEWCDDWFLLDFAVPNNPDNEPRERWKSVRGGNSVAGKGWPRCTARQSVEPERRHYTIGFRMVRAL